MKKKTLLHSLLSDMAESQDATIELPWIGNLALIRRAPFHPDADFPASNQEEEEFEAPRTRTFTLSDIADFWHEREGVTAFIYGGNPFPSGFLIALPYQEFKAQLKKAREGEK